MLSTRTSGPSAVVAAVAGAALIVAVPLTLFVDGDFFLVVPAGLLLLAAALPGLRAALPGGGGPVTTQAARAAATGAALAGGLLVAEGLGLDEVLPHWLGWVALAGGLAVGIGLLVVAAGAVTRRARPRWAWWALVVAPVVAVIGESLADVELLDALGISGIVVTGAAVLAIALAVLTGPPAPAASGGRGSRLRR